MFSRLGLCLESKCIHFLSSCLTSSGQNSRAASGVTDSATAWLATKWVVIPRGYALSTQNAYQIEFYGPCHIRANTELSWLLSRVLVSVQWISLALSGWLFSLFFFIMALPITWLSFLQRLKEDVTTESWLCGWMEPSSDSLDTCCTDHRTSNNPWLLLIPPLKIWNQHLWSV